MITESQVKEFVTQHDAVQVVTSVLSPGVLFLRVIKHRQIGQPSVTVELAVDESQTLRRYLQAAERRVKGANA